MNLHEINEKGWELAICAMCNDRGKLVPYSAKQIRRALEGARNENFHQEFNRMRDDYSPPDEKRHLVEHNRTFWNELLSLSNDMNSHEAYQMMLYCIWNIETLRESNLDQLQELFRAEVITNERGLMTKITEKSRQSDSSRHRPGNSRNDYSRGPSRHNERYSGGGRRKQKPWEDLRREYASQRR